VLLDTHALLWFFAGDKRLSDQAREAIEASDNTRLFSDASLWEISIKQSIGKLVLEEPFAENLSASLQRNAIDSLPIEKSHIFGVASLPFHHRDPFDRLLISAAIVEGLPIVTDDPAYRDYPVELVW